KVTRPSAGLEIPSIFCSTQGPRSVLVVVPAVMVCQGQANLMCGRCTLMPTRWKAADRAMSTTAAIARRKISPITTTTADHLTQRGTQRGGGVPGVPGGPGSPAAGGASPGGGAPASPGPSGRYPGGYGWVSTPPPAVAVAYLDPYQAACCRPGRFAVSTPSRNTRMRTTIHLLPTVGAGAYAVAG